MKQHQMNQMNTNIQVLTGQSLINFYTKEKDYLVSLYKKSRSTVFRNKIMEEIRFFEAGIRNYTKELKYRNYEDSSLS